MLPPPTTVPGTVASTANFDIAFLVFAALLLIPVGYRMRRKVKRRQPTEWQRRSRRIIRKQGGRCRWNGNYLAYPDGGDHLNMGWQRGCNQRKVDGHHMTYEHYGAERDDEVIPLCRYHHSLVPTRPHPPFAEQQIFFGVTPSKRKKVAA